MIFFEAIIIACMIMEQGIDKQKFELQDKLSTENTWSNDSNGLVRSENSCENSYENREYSGLNSGSSSQAKSCETEIDHSCLLKAIDQRMKEFRCQLFSELNKKYLQRSEAQLPLLSEAQIEDDDRSELNAIDTIIPASRTTSSTTSSVIDTDTKSKDLQISTDQTSHPSPVSRSPALQAMYLYPGIRKENFEALTLRRHRSTLSSERFLPGLRSTEHFAGNLDKFIVSSINFDDVVNQIY